MMGQQKGNQDRLFYSFNLDEHIPANHLLRAIDGCLELKGLCAPTWKTTTAPRGAPRSTRS